mgnify:CR=1 FL=1
MHETAAAWDAITAMRELAATALRGFTTDAAFAGFAEGSVGSLAVGKRADFVLLAQDPLAIDPSQLDDFDVLATYVDGEAVYRRP